MNFQEAREEYDKGNNGPLIELIIRNQLPVLNSLESHLGCALCHEPLDGKICRTCQDENGKVRDGV